MKARAMTVRPSAFLISLALLLAGMAGLVAFALATRASAHAPSGAIFTTLVDGTQVNENHFATKPDVYLDGGPGPGAPQGAAGLDDGDYVFQVTDPSGDTLLSTDKAGCRQFHVSAGIITGVIPFGGCEHATGDDTDHPPAKTVQLIPFDDTPNPGGVYKVWIIELNDFLTQGCGDLDVVDCGLGPNDHHGFVHGHTKTDNFKVDGEPHEIDIRFFYDGDGNGRYNEDHDSLYPSMQTTWTDTVGANNIRWSDSDYYTFAHVEAAETGRHKISLFDQADCEIGEVSVSQWVGSGAGAKLTTNKTLRSGPQNVTVTFSNRDETSAVTWYVDAECK